MQTTDDYTIEDSSAAKLRVSPEGLKLFKESPLALSVHWGLYSLSTEHANEWVYYTSRIPHDEYLKRMEMFNPTRFCADEWADLMVEAGMKFLLITSKHHDGFCLWDTQYTDFKVTNTAFKRDVLAELAEALHARGVGLHFYYSLVDWTHPAYRDDWPGYVEYYQGQIRELCTDYGPIGGFLFDGYWPRQAFDGDETTYFTPGGPFDLAGTYDLIHSLQPDAVITNNTHVPPTAGEDYQVWEVDLPGENTMGFNCTEAGDKPKACWWNLNTGWSYQPWSHRLKSENEILSTMQEAKARDAVFMLNVGPRPFGDIHPEEQRVLRQIGQTRRQYRL